MSKTLSEDLRSRVVAAIDGGLSRRRAAERFGIGYATAIRWMRDWRATGSVSAKPRGGPRGSHRIEAHYAVVMAAIDAQIDITLVEIVALLREQHGVSFAPSSIRRLLDRHGVTIKKNSARQRAGQARCCRAATRLVQSVA